MTTTHKAAPHKPNQFQAAHLKQAELLELPQHTCPPEELCQQVVFMLEMVLTQHKLDKGWSTLGDVGYLDPEGFLFLTDRKSFMIISGGVNIYPQEIENHLVTHPRVQDVAVIGGPHEEMGEEVIAVIQPVDMADATDAFRDEILSFAREKLSGVKMPRRIDFLEQLPRHDTGKLYKRLLRDQYWAKVKG